MELNLELVVDVSGTGVWCREEHVQGNLKVWQHVAICNLNVLDLCGICLALKSLNTHELDLNRLDLNL